jgi:hypothetical protein
MPINAVFTQTTRSSAAEALLMNVVFYDSMRNEIRAELGGVVEKEGDPIRMFPRFHAVFTLF